MDEFYDILEQIGHYLLLTDVTALALICFICCKENQMRTTLIVLLTVVIAGGFMSIYTPVLLTFSQENTQYTAFNRFIWYMGFTGFDVLIMWLIFKLHVKFQLAYGFVAKSYLLAFTLLAQLQLIQYIEVLIWNEKDFLDYYQVGIVAINAGTSLVAITFTVLICLSRFQISRGRKGLSWNY